MVMGEMMGAGMWAWLPLWIFLGLAVAVAAGFAGARALGWHRGDRPQVSSGEVHARQEAMDSLRLRYAKGQISREDYLQGKVELED